VQYLQADAYLAVIAATADHSGGGVISDVPRTVRDCPDHEDNLILDLAADSSSARQVPGVTSLSYSPVDYDRGCICAGGSASG
jgi:hypothetical protein